jgi:hypothetical protein
MAEAWLRLRSGRTYEQAHAAANEISNWQNQIPARPTRTLETLEATMGMMVVGWKVAKPGLVVRRV